MKNFTVLIISGDRNVNLILRVMLQDIYNILVSTDTADGLKKLSRHDIDLVLLDAEMRCENISGFFAVLRQEHEDTRAILVARLGDIRSEAIQHQDLVLDLLPKEFLPYEIINAVERASRVARQRLSSNRTSESASSGFGGVDYVIGNSSPMQHIFGTAEKIAKLPTTVMITGESGTGKEILASHICRHSARVGKPFVTLDLASVSPGLIESTLFGHEKGSFTSAYRQSIGKFELANTGTLFLDEVSQLKYELQGKLLRVIQKGEFERVGGQRTIKVDVRLIAATNVDLWSEVNAGRFRSDLFFRLNVIPLKLPPLSERKEDIRELAEFFLDKWNNKLGKNVRCVDDSVMDMFLRYGWPGNVRELGNIMERLVAICDTDKITAALLPPEIVASRRLPMPLSEYPSNLKEALFIFEKELLSKKLQEQNYSKVKTARALGIPLSTLKFKLKKFKIPNRVE